MSLSICKIYLSQREKTSFGSCALTRIAEIQLSVYSKLLLYISLSLGRETFPKSDANPMALIVVDALHKDCLANAFKYLYGNIIRCLANIYKAILKKFKKTA